jgi:N-acetyl-anhydromuramyl-L-alanine amidase AmpD
MKNFAAALAVVVSAVLSVVALSVTLNQDGTVKIRVGPSSERVVTIGEHAAPDAPVIAVDKDQQLSAEQAVADAAEDPVSPDVHEDLRDEQPAGAPPDAAAKVLDSPLNNVTAPKPAVGAQNYNCVPHPVRNWSNRAAGTHVLSFKLHVAVATPSDASLPAIRRLFDTPSFAASSHLGLAPSGTCEQWVPWNRKAWTQGAFNSTSDSVEIMARGTESRATWLSWPIFKQGILASIVADRLRARGLPPRLVDPVGCTDRAGYTDHERLECGNTHVDVGHGFPWDVFGQQVRRAYYGAEPVVAKHKAACSTRAVQARLNAGGAGLDVDGVTGPKTRAALRRFQRNHKLPATGRVDAKTGAALGCRL